MQTRDPGAADKAACPTDTTAVVAGGVAVASAVHTVSRKSFPLFPPSVPGDFAAAAATESNGVDNLGTRCIKWRCCVRVPTKLPRGAPGKFVAVRSVHNLGPTAMKLFYAPQSPFARKVRAAAIELGLAERLELEYVEVVPGQPNTAFGASRNPLRKIPALVTDAGETIFDSTVICEYLDALAGGGFLIPKDPMHRWRVLTSHALAQGMCESIILIRYETWLRPEALRWHAWSTTTGTGCTPASAGLTAMKVN
jgi:hypothetical protein